MQDMEKLKVNPSVVFRNDFDDFAILFDPETGKAYGLNPVGELIWELLGEEITIVNVIEKLKEICCNVTDEVVEEVNDFIDSLIQDGLIGRKK